MYLFSMQTILFFNFDIQDNPVKTLLIEVYSDITMAKIFFISTHYTDFKIKTVICAVQLFLTGQAFYIGGSRYNFYEK